MSPLPRTCRRSDLTPGPTTTDAPRFFTVAQAAQCLGFPPAVMDTFAEMRAGPSREYDQHGTPRYQAVEVGRYSRFAALILMADSVRQDEVPAHEFDDHE